MAENDRIIESTPTNGQSHRSKWTVMVYLAGDNNLTANCISVLQQLEAVAYNDDVRVLACFDSNTPWPKGSRYLDISRRRQQVHNNIDWEIHNDLIPPQERGHKLTPPSFCPDDDYAPLNGEPITRPEVAEGLKRFIDWAMTNNDSDKYMLILYGHGPVVAGRTFLARDNPPSSLRLEDLKPILRKHFGPNRDPKPDRPKLDILACQNCVMNGIETAYEIRHQVKYMIGSQGLVLADGWPYKRILDAIVKNPKAEAKEVAGELLKVCARHLLDFSVMDRSSEQSVCNLERLSDDGNIITAVRDLATVLKEALDFDNQEEKQLLYPVVVDAVKLARLEAQSYWGEVFVDLYDFCERLLKKCNEAVKMHSAFLQNIDCYETAKAKLEKNPLFSTLTDIADCCITVLNEIEGTRQKGGTGKTGEVPPKTGGVVEQSYYIGPDLQYSHGLSIYFPWTLPGEPYFFTKSANNGEFVLRTAFETYSRYKFVINSGWGEFLMSFYKATLRKVRRSDRDFAMKNDGDYATGVVEETPHAPDAVLAVDLQKSSSDTGQVDHDVWSTVKNYPRRNYLSPSDCGRRRPKRLDEEVGGKVVPKKDYSKTNSPDVSYLGWNMPELVAKLIIKSDPADKPSNEQTAVYAESAGAGGATGTVTSAEV